MRRSPIMFNQGMDTLGSAAEDAAFDIFDLSADDVVSNPEGEGGYNDPLLYRPSISHKNAKNKAYSSRIRPITNVHESTKTDGGKIVPWNIYSKWIYYWKKEGDKEGGIYIDCPSNDDKSRNSIITTAFFMLKDHDIQTFRDIAKTYFSRKKYHWSLFQILLDVQDPELQGQVKIMRYGNQLYDLIEAQRKSDASMGKVGTVVWDPFQGKDLLFKVYEGTGDSGQKMTKYDQCLFDDSKTGMTLTGKLEDKITMAQVNDPATRSAVREYLIKNSPKLVEKVKFQPWTESDEEKYVSMMKVIINDDRIFNDIVRETRRKGGLLAKKQYEMGGSSTSLDQPITAQFDASALPKAEPASNIASAVSEIAAATAAPAQAPAPIAATDTAPAAPMAQIATPAAASIVDASDNANATLLPTNETEQEQGEVAFDFSKLD